MAVLFPITLCHNFFVRTLPLMLGEFSYIVLLRRHLKIPVSEGLRSLFEARLFDLQFVIVGGTFGLLTMGHESIGYVLTVLVPRWGPDYSKPCSFYCSPQRYRTNMDLPSSEYVLGVTPLYWTPPVIN